MCVLMNRHAGKGCLSEADKNRRQQRSGKRKLAEREREKEREAWSKSAGGEIGRRGREK